MISCPLSGMGFDHDALEREHRKMHIFAQEPPNFWPSQDILCALPCPPIVLSWKEEPDVYVFGPHDIMDTSSVKADEDSGHFQVTYHNDYQTARDRMEAHYAVMGVPASSSFQSRYNVSPVDSLEPGFSANQWAQPAYVQPPEQPYTWPSQYQPLSGSYTGGADYQTDFIHPHVQPGASAPYMDSWRYANAPSTMSTDSVGHMYQTAFYQYNDNTGSFSSALNATGGSFSSSHDAGSSFSSTFTSSSLGDTLSVAEAFPPRAFYNSTPIDTYDVNGGRVQELSTSPRSPENYFAPSYSMSSSSASSPAAMDSDAAHSSSEPTALVTTRPGRNNRSNGRRKLPDKQPRGHPARRRSTPPPPKPLLAARRGRSTATVSSPSSLTPSHTRNTRSNSKMITGPSSRQNSRPEDHQLQLYQPEPRQGRQQVQLQLQHRQGRQQAQLRPVTYTQAPRAAAVQLAIEAPPTPQPPITQENSQLSEKDKLLIRLKESGMGYKDIQKKGGFTEAVSTLRGRYRTLTKPKEARVRKPAWTDRDLRLLEQAVRSYTSGSTSDLRTAKIPWMRVAGYIADNGGYHFGNSTCRKRWDELYAAEVRAGKDPSHPFYAQWSSHGIGR